LVWVSLTPGSPPLLLSPGSEFLLPVRGFYCRLCKEFYGDAICAEEHVTTHAHNEKYKVGGLVFWRQARLLV
jgi:hypothetical protein